MPPRFHSCPLCGQQFGSASIGIHVPQCYEKQLKRWETLPFHQRGPKPAMPRPIGSTSGGGNWGSMMESSGDRLNGSGGRDRSERRDDDDSPKMPTTKGRGGSSRPMPPAVPVQQYEPMDLPRCRFCKRHFAPDRLMKHEDVCIERDGAHRKRFNAKKQRLSGFDTYELGRPGKGAGNIRSPAAVPTTNWRQQHAEFIRAVRSARAAGPMPGTQSWQQEARGGRRDQMAFGSPGGRPPASTGFRGGANGPNVRPAPGRREGSSSSPASAFGRAGVEFAPPPQSRNSRPAPAQARASNRRGGGGGGGGGPSYQIANTNETSQGMRDVFGWK